MIKETLRDLQISDKNKHYGIILASIMFVWSGFDKIQNFDKKVNTLVKKTSWPNWFSSTGMVLVILLETIGFFILMDYYSNSNILLKDSYEIHDEKLTKKEIVQGILLALLAFLIVVTLIYHPLDFEHPIPFFSNLTTFGLFLYVYADLHN